MSLPFKVEVVMQDHPEDLRALEDYARSPGRTIDQCHEWILLKGYPIKHRSAVASWRAKFVAQCLQERFSRSSELAAALRGAVDSDFDQVATAAKMQLTNVVLEQVAQLEADGKVDPLDIQRMTRSLANLVDTEERQRKMMGEKFAKEVKSRQDRSGRRELTAEDIAAVEKAVFG